MTQYLCRWRWYVRVGCCLHWSCCAIVPMVVSRGYQLCWQDSDDCLICRRWQVASHGSGNAPTCSSIRLLPLHLWISISQSIGD